MPEWRPAAVWVHRRFSALSTACAVVGAAFFVPLYIGLHETPSERSPFSNGWVILGAGAILASVVIFLIALVMRVVVRPRLRVIRNAAIGFPMSWWQDAMNPVEAEAARALGYQVAASVILTNESDAAASYKVCGLVELGTDTPRRLGLETNPESAWVSGIRFSGAGGLLPDVVNIPGGHSLPGYFVYYVPPEDLGHLKDVDDVLGVCSLMFEDLGTRRVFTHLILGPR